MRKLFAEIKWINFLYLTVAGLINSIGVTMFLAPVNLYDSGISGTSILLSQLTEGEVPLSMFLIILNVPLFLFGLKKQGMKFTIYSLYAVAMYSMFAWLITDVLPIDVSMISPLAGSDLLLCSIFGGLISGVGSGLTIRFGGAIDGMEVLSVIFAKKLGLTVGSFVMIYNVILYICCGLAINSWILPLYSIVAYFVALKTIDFVVEGFDRSKAAMVVTSRPDKVAGALSDAFETGVTLIPAKGYFSGEQKTVLYIVLNRFQIPRAREIVHDEDPTAYITITEVADVFIANTEKV